MGSIFACGIDGAKVSRACKMLMKRACQIIQGSALASFFSEYCPSLLIPWKKWPQQKPVSADYPGCFALAGPTGMFGRIGEYPAQHSAMRCEFITEGTLREMTMVHVEQLENRCLLSSFTAASVAELIVDINAANAAGGANTITLAAGSTFKLNAVADNNFGPTGLPVIAAGDDLTIVGNGATIQRSTATGTPAFRLFAVALGGALAMNNLTLANGLGAPAPTVGARGKGGAIANEGTLSLNGVTVQNCIARG